MIFLFQRFLTHYQLPIFRKLNDILRDSLILIHGQPRNESYFFNVSEETLSFKTLQVKNTWFKGETAVWQNFWEPFKGCEQPDAVIMEQSPRILSLFPLYFYCKVRRIPFILWGHGGSRKRSVSKSLNMKDIIHRWMIRKADAYICYTDGIKGELSKITKPEKLFVARNTLDTETLFLIRSDLEREGKEAIKKRLGLDRQHYICFIGRLLADKKVDFLIDVYGLVKQRFPDTGLLMIGDGPARVALVDYASGQGLEDVHFLGGIADWEQSGPYLFASNVMVMPGCVGLSVNHAFCFGLAVLTQKSGKNGPFHGPEVEYIEDGKTGFFCKNEDQNEMADKIIEVFENQSYFKEKTLNYCKRNLSIETMVAGMKEAIDFVLKPKR